MLSGLKKYINEHKLLKANDKILLCVSGGIDSIVMLDLFSKLSFNCAIAHCNFGLRGEESDRDEQFVKDLSARHNIPFFSKKFDTQSYATNKKISIQMAARDLRINWTEELIDQLEFNYYATAHHLDDQIETFFINLIRGTGIAGIHGITSHRNKLLHPMLYAYRSDIETYARENNLEFMMDSSNLKSDYTRNQIRNNLLPVIHSIKQDYRKILTGNINRFRSAEEIYKQQIRIASEKVVSRRHGHIFIHLKNLHELHPVDSYLFEFISMYNFNYNDVKDILESLKNESGKKFFSKTHRLVKDREYLIIEKMDLIHKNHLKEYVIGIEDRAINEPIQLKLLKVVDIQGFSPSRDTKHASLDLDKLNFPLKIKKRENGDFFYPFGMNKKKLISDYYIDNKFSIPKKEKTWLLCSGDDIVWIIGHRIDNRFRVTNKTKKILRIEFLSQSNSTDFQKFD